MFKMDTKVEQFRTSPYVPFIITIVESDTMFESWITHEGYGRMEYMFGIEKGMVSKEEFIELVEANADEYEDIVFDNMIKEA